MVFKFDVVVNVQTSADDIRCLKDSLESITNQGESIMTAIKDFADKQAAFNVRVDAAVVGLQGDIKALNDEIVKLQTSPGPISTEDQASLDALQVHGEAIAAKLEALDALTPPVAPVV